MEPRLEVPGQTNGAPAKSEHGGTPQQSFEWLDILNSASARPAVPTEPRREEGIEDAILHLIRVYRKHKAATGTTVDAQSNVENMAAEIVRLREENAQLALRLSRQQRELEEYKIQCEELQRELSDARSVRLQVGTMRLPRTASPAPVGSTSTLPSRHTPAKSLQPHKPLLKGITTPSPAAPSSAPPERTFAERQSPVSTENSGASSRSDDDEIIIVDENPAGSSASIRADHGSSKKRRPDSFAGAFHDSTSGSRPRKRRRTGETPGVATPVAVQSAVSAIGSPAWHSTKKPHAGGVDGHTSVEGKALLDAGSLIDLSDNEEHTESSTTHVTSSRARPLFAFSDEVEKLTDSTSITAQRDLMDLVSKSEGTDRTKEGREHGRVLTIAEDATMRGRPTKPASVRPEFAHVVTVRKKEERAALPARECPHCKAFYDAVAESSDESEAARKRIVHHCSRHRELFEAPATPHGFWELGFGSQDTQR